MRVTEHALRRGSGGGGALRGGDGIVREIEALAEMDFSLLTERRRHRPPGAAGGRPGALGRNLLRRAGADVPEELPGKVRGRLDRVTSCGSRPPAAAATARRET